MKPLVLILLMMVAISVPVHAQQMSFGVGATLDGNTSPNAAASVAVLVSSDGGKAFSYTTIDMRGLKKGQVPTFLGKQGMAYAYKTQGRLMLLADGQAGGAVSQPLASGVFSFGNLIQYQLRPNAALMLGIHGQWGAAQGDLKPVIQAWIVLTPK